MNRPTLTWLLWERMLEEKTQHFPRCVRSSRISVGARRAAPRPCVSSSVDVPVLKDSAPPGVGMDRAGVAMPSRYPPAMHLLLRARGGYRLFNDMIAVAGMHGDVPIAMKDDGRRRRPVSRNGRVVAGLASRSRNTLPPSASGRASPISIASSATMAVSTTRLRRTGTTCRSRPCNTASARAATAAA